MISYTQQSYTHSKGTYLRLTMMQHRLVYMMQILGPTPLTLAANWKAPMCSDWNPWTYCNEIKFKLHQIKLKGKDSLYKDIDKALYNLKIMDSRHLSTTYKRICHVGASKPITRCLISNLYSFLLSLYVQYIFIWVII